MMTVSADPRPTELPAAIARLEAPVTDEQIGRLGRLQDIRERAKHHRTIIRVWKQQQDQDRAMRRTYATWLMVVMTAQIAAVTLIFLLLGFGAVKYEPWTATTFVMATFAEVSALVLLVVKYLFPVSADKVLDLIDRFRPRE